jgi:hypothetical protein
MVENCGSNMKPLNLKAQTTIWLSLFSILLISFAVRCSKLLPFRKLTKTKGAFPNENSLLKLLYLGIQNASKKWTMPIRNWSLTISQLAIFFEGRIDKYLEI